MQYIYRAVEEKDNGINICVCIYACVSRSDSAVEIVRESGPMCVQ